MIGRKNGRNVGINHIYGLKQVFSYMLISSMLLKTFSTVDWSVFFWFEWNFTFITAISAGCLVHFSVSSIV